MIERVFFSLQQGIQHRAQLKIIPYADSVTLIDWQALWEAGIRVIVLDFDGVLAADRQQKIADNIFPVLSVIQKIFGNRVYILSNQPTPERQAYFALHFPWVQFLVAKQKPYPDGLLTVIQREQVNPEQVILIDDRVLTGGVAAILANVKCILVEKPIISYPGNVLRETMFCAIRTIERALFR